MDLADYATEKMCKVSLSSLHFNILFSVAYIYTNTLFNTARKVIKQKSNT